MLLDPDLGYYDEGLDLTASDLYRSACGTLGEATTLPPASYRSKVFASLEDNRVWSRSWIAVGSGLQIPNEGDVLPFTIGYHGIHLQRMPDGSIAGRFNKAQHGGCRAVPLQCQTGSRTKCSFTACGYSRDRDVIPAAELDDDATSAQQYLGLRPERLLPVRVAEQGPLLFACLDPRTAELKVETDDFLTPAQDRADAETGLLARKWIIAPANWKLIGSAFAALLTDEAAMSPGEAGAVEAPMRPLREIETNTGPVPSAFEGAAAFTWLFPNLLLVRSETAAIAVLLQPLSMSETQLRVLCFGDPEADADPVLDFALRLSRKAGELAADSQDRLGDWGTSRAPETIGLAPPVQGNPVGLAFQQFLINSILTPRS